LSTLNADGGSQRMDSDRRFVFKQDGNASFTAGPKLGNDVDESRRGLSVT
jgi:hypothetical protein